MIFVFHSSSEALKNQVSLMELRHLLTNYDLRHYDVCATSKAETLLYHILKQDRATAMEDSTYVLGAYDHLTPNHAHVFRLKFLIARNRVKQH